MHFPDGSIFFLSNLAPINVLMQIRYHYQLPFVSTFCIRVFAIFGGSIQVLLLNSLIQGLEVDCRMGQITIITLS